MRYLVIASCEDVRTGKEFEAGDEFLPEPDIDQAARLKNAGCLREIPDNAPALPGSNDSVQIIADLRAKLGENANKAEGEYNALNARLQETTKAYDELVAKFQGELDKRETAQRELAEARTEHDRLTALNTGLTARVGELEGLLEAATKPVANSAAGDQPDANAGKTPKAKS